MSLFVKTRGTGQRGQAGGGGQAGREGGELRGAFVLGFKIFIFFFKVNVTDF